MPPITTAAPTERTYDATVELYLSEVTVDEFGFLTDFRLGHTEDHVLSGEVLAEIVRPSINLDEPARIRVYDDGDSPGRYLPGHPGTPTSPSIAEHRRWINALQRITTAAKASGMDAELAELHGLTEHLTAELPTARRFVHDVVAHEQASAVRRMTDTDETLLAVDLTAEQAAEHAAALNDAHRPAGAASTIEQAGPVPPTLYTADQAIAAANAACDEIHGRLHDSGNGSGEEDIANLMVNLTATFLADPEATFETALAEAYGSVDDASFLGEVLALPDAVGEGDAETEHNVSTYTATFRAEAWQNDATVQVDPQGPTTWDCTRFLNEPAHATLRASADLSAIPVIDRGDLLQHDPAAPDWVRQWAGPFTITVARG